MATVLKVTKSEGVGMFGKGHIHVHEIKENPFGYGDDIMWIHFSADNFVVNLNESACPTGFMEEFKSDIKRDDDGTPTITVPIAEWGRAEILYIIWRYSIWYQKVGGCAYDEIRIDGALDLALK